MYKSTTTLIYSRQQQKNSPGVERFSAESENIEFSLGRGLVGLNDEFSFALGAAKTMLDGSEYMVNSITVPSEGAETVDCKTYVKACFKNCFENWKQCSRKIY